jgi:hypothetical protein
VDFGYLDLEQQLDLTRLLQGDQLVCDLRTLNREAARPVHFPADFTERVEEAFGLEPHASRLAAAFESLFSENYNGNATDNVSNRLLDLFFRPIYHRPLIGEW